MYVHMVTQNMPGPDRIDKMTLQPNLKTVFSEII
jgi:hypothetical protein